VDAQPAVLLGPDLDRHDAREGEIDLLVAHDIAELDLIVRLSVDHQFADPRFFLPDGGGCGAGNEDRDQHDAKRWSHGDISTKCSGILALILRRSQAGRKDRT